MIQLASLIKRYCLLVCLVCGAMSLYASPDFRPQFRWQQDGITVADNHEQINTPSNAPNQPAAPPENQPAPPPEKSVDNAEKVIETMEISIQIDDIIEPPASYRYSSFNKRDPFTYPDREELLDDEFAISKLQRHDVSSLKLVGVWRLSTGVSKALVLTPTGEGVVAVIGDPIGQNNGEVMEIGKNKIIVREYLMTPDGTRQFNDIDMFLEDYFAPNVASGEGLQVISDPANSASLEEELNRLLQDVKSIHNAPDVSVNKPASAPNNMPASAPNNMPANAPNNKPANAPNNMPANAPNNMPANAPNNMPANAPNNMPANAPNNMPANAPNQPQGAP